MNLRKLLNSIEKSADPLNWVFIIDNGDGTYFAEWSNSSDESYHPGAMMRGEVIRMGGVVINVEWESL